MLARLLGVRPPQESVPRWHVSPAVDVLAYHFSWVFALVPLLFLGDTHPKDYLYMLLAILAGNFAHQALSLPLVYLDGEIFRRFRLRCTVFPVLMIAAFWLCLKQASWMVPPRWFTPVDAMSAAGAVAVLFQLWLLARRGAVASFPVVVLAIAVPFLPWLLPSAPWPVRWELLLGLALLSLAIARETPGGRARYVAPLLLAAVAIWGLLDPFAAGGRWPTERFKFSLVYSTLAVIASLWNFWHVYMQKYGILRVYNAKAGRLVPAWVDRLLVFGWLPLTIVVLGPRHRAYLLLHYPAQRPYLKPFLDWLQVWQPWLWLPTIGLAVLSVVLFLRREWVAHRFRNVPRLSMGSGTLLLFASLLLVNPIKAVLAFGFSHVLEYFVFVWAYERRRYCAPLPHRPPLAALLRHPVVAYLLFALLVGGGYFLFANWGKHVFKDQKPPRLFGAGLPVVLPLVATFQAMTHFYFDGFLWKMRQPAVSRNL